MLDVDAALRMEQKQSLTTLNSKRICDLKNKHLSTSQKKYYTSKMSLFGVIRRCVLTDVGSTSPTTTDKGRYGRRLVSSSAVPLPAPATI